MGQCGLNDKIPLLKNKCLLRYFELMLEMEKLWDVVWHHLPQHVLIIGDIDLVPSATKKYQPSASCPDEDCVCHSARLTVFSFILGALHTL